MAWAGSGPFRDTPSRPRLSRSSWLPIQPGSGDNSGRFSPTWNRGVTLKLAQTQAAGQPQWGLALSPYPRCLGHCQELPEPTQGPVVQPGPACFRDKGWLNLGATRRPWAPGGHSEDMPMHILTHTCLLLALLPPRPVAAAPPWAPCSAGALPGWWVRPEQCLTRRKCCFPTPRRETQSQGPPILPTERSRGTPAGGPRQLRLRWPAVGITGPDPCD